MKHVDDLEKGKKIERPLLGITHINANETAILSQYGIKLDSSIEEGIAVISVVEDSSAEKAGLKAGDVIIKLDDDKVTNSAYLKYLLYQHSVGDKIKLTYLRGKEEKVAEVTLTDYAE